MKERLDNMIDMVEKTDCIVRGIFLSVDAWHDLVAYMAQAGDAYFYRGIRTKADVTLDKNLLQIEF